MTKQLTVGLNLKCFHMSKNGVEVLMDRGKSIQVKILLTYFFLLIKRGIINLKLHKTCMM